MSEKQLRTSRMEKREWYRVLVGAVAKRSTCARREAGAIAFDKYGRIVGSGFNGVPKGFPHCFISPCEGANDPPGDTSRCSAIHAEVNCIVNSFNPMEIHTMVCSVSPCFNCALVMANLPSLRKVYYLGVYADRRGVDILALAGVELCNLTPLEEPGESPTQ